MSSDSVCGVHASTGPARTLYVDVSGGIVRKQRGRFVVEQAEGEKCEEVLEVPAVNIERATVVGRVHCTTAAHRFFLREEIPVTFLSRGGRVLGRLDAPVTSRADVRLSQYKAHNDLDAALPFARALVSARLRNMAVLLRRYHRRRDEASLAATADRIETLRDRCDGAQSRETLRGLEGQGTHLYFQSWPLLIQRSAPAFAFAERSRRPPGDAVNALLSFTYALLQNDIHAACVSAHLDACVGVLHQPRPGCPSAVLDLMEAFRPAVGDTTVLALLNRERIQTNHFEERDGGVYLNEPGRKQVYRAYEDRRASTVTPTGREDDLPYYRVMELQARRLARALTDEEATYTPYHLPK
jgi:CRISPR-associated protein Cas1